MRKNKSKNSLVIKLVIAAVVVVIVTSLFLFLYNPLQPSIANNSVSSANNSISSTNDPVSSTNDPFTDCAIKVTRSFDISSLQTERKIKVILSTSMDKEIKSSLGFDETIPDSWILSPESLSEEWTQSGKNIEKFIITGSSKEYIYTLIVPNDKPLSGCFSGKVLFTEGDNLTTCPIVEKSCI